MLDSDFIAAPTFLRLSDEPGTEPLVTPH